MKKLALILALLMLLSCTMLVRAEEEATVYTSGDYKYILLEDGTAEITEYNGEAEALEIPAELDGYAVTAIGEAAFFYCEYLTDITIPDSVTTICNYAFYSCDFLTDITIPDSVVSMGANPFLGCDSLTDIQVSPDHTLLEMIDGVLFDKTEKKLICYPYAFTAESYSVPQGVTAIGDYAFYGCDSLSSVTIPEGVTAIGDYAFFVCESLTDITIPEGVTTIGDAAFYSCDSLTSVTIPNSVTSIGIDAFYGPTDNFTITAESGSYAADYAQEKGIACVNG